MGLLPERIKELPFRDGDLDIDSLVSIEELVEEDGRRMSALFDEDFERFLRVMVYRRQRRHQRRGGFTTAGRVSPEMRYHLPRLSRIYVDDLCCS